MMQKRLTKQEKIDRAIERLKKVQQEWNRESAHAEADEILINLLVQLGCEEVVMEWNRVEKWYA